MSKHVDPGLALAVFLSGAAMAGSAAATTINFDDLSDLDVVGSHYAGVTFSSNPGEQVLASEQSPPYQTSPHNFICTGTTVIDCTHDVFVDFATPVKGLTFLSTGADNSGLVGNVDVYVNHVLAGSVGLFGIGQVHTAQFVDLSAFSNVTGIVIDNVTDPAGLGYDDFNFTFMGGGIPEPAVWAMMIAGFGMVGAALRRRTSAALAARA
jgi:hypothetical protein